MKLIKGLVGLQAKVGDGHQNEKERDEGDYLKEINVYIIRRQKITILLLKKYIYASIGA